MVGTEGEQGGGEACTLSGEGERVRRMEVGGDTMGGGEGGEQCSEA